MDLTFKEEKENPHLFSPTGKKSDRNLRLLISTLILLMVFVTYGQVTAPERAALQALYSALDGPNWNSQNDADITDDWDFSQPVTNAWYGLTVVGTNVTEIAISQFNDQNNLTGFVPPEIGDFPALTELLIEYADLSGTNIPTEIGNLTSLTSIELGNNNLSGAIPTSIGNLINLTFLGLDFNALSGSIPPEIGNLINLERLVLSNNSLNGSIPNEITQLTQLLSLNLDRNQLTGSLPVNIGNLSNLENLLFYENQLSGSIPTSIGNLTNMTFLWGSHNQLSGNIPSEIGLLNSVTRIWLNDNTLSGSIPPELGNLTNVLNVSLGNNQLSGSLPPELQGMTNLETLSLTNNQLTGNIPSELGNLPNLISLLLQDNQLSGSIPIELGNLSTLKGLLLNNNQLSGNIPSELGNLSNLETLYLFTNQLTGLIPTELTNIVNLKNLLLNDNTLSGPIPDFTNNTNLSSFRIYNNAFQFGDFENEVQTYENNISTFWYNPQAKVDTQETHNLNQGDNINFVTNCNGTQNNYQWFKDNVTLTDGGTFSGTQTATLSLNNIQLADAGVYHCEVTSSLFPYDGGTFQDLVIERNDITLNVTAAACSIPQAEMDALMALYNSTNGPNWTSETDGDSTNDWDIANPIENWFGLTVDCSNSTVTKIELIQSNTSGNNLVGTIPPELQDLVNLTVFNLSYNTISGSIIPEIYTLTSLETLNLDKNQLTGNLSSQVANLTNLVSLQFEDNQLNGVIPVELGTLNNLFRIWLGGNQFTGNIPIELGNLTGLDQLYLDGNQLTGSIPNELTNIPDLDWLLMNNNNFSGTIPDFTYNVSMIWFSIGSNAFQFGDFETEFNGYDTNLNVFQYLNQAKVDAIETRNLNVGNNTTMVTNCSGSQNNYQWYKDGVVISGATNATFNLNNLQLTDAGVYHCDVTSDIVTGLTIQRNTITLNVSQTIPNCTQLSSPADGMTDVLITSNLTWTAVSNADGYRITIGTTPGGTDIENNTDLGNATTYTPTGNWAETTTYYVTVVAYNSAGDATGCNETLFTTETIVTIPNCTALSSPADGMTDVLITSNLTWTAVSNADGYRITIGTTPGGTDIENNTDLGNVTSYTPTGNWLETTTYYVTVVAYNSAGDATGCNETLFTTETIVTIPNCTQLTSPADGMTDVLITSNLTWTAVGNADGYRITIGTTPGGTDIENNTDLGNATTYTPTGNWAETTTYYVTVVAYNSAGDATGCNETLFTTETIVTIPNCTQLSSPADGMTDVLITSNLTWTAVGNADGYRITIGTTPGGTDIENNTDLGNVTSYTPTGNWLETTTYYVTVVAYNSAGDATGCNETSFTTETIVTIPNCTQLSSPADGMTDVLITSNLTWTAVSNADGYRITIGTTPGGTTPGGTDIENNTDLGNVTSYTPTGNWAETTTYYVTVVAYNSAGDATGCTETSFTTETIVIVGNDIPNFFTPNGDGHNDYWQVIDEDKTIKGIQIFDRYGKVLKQFTTSEQGWDGSYIGKPMPSDDYWFVIVYSDGKVVNGHFSLIRR